MYCNANSNTTLVICNDTATNCEELMNLGKCIGNPGYMDKYCKKTCEFCNGTGSHNYNNINSLTQTLLAIFVFFLCMGCIIYWTDKYEDYKIRRRREQREDSRARDRAFSKKMAQNNPFYLDV